MIKLQVPIVGFAILGLSLQAGCHCFHCERATTVPPTATTSATVVPPASIGPNDSRDTGDLVPDCKLTHTVAFTTSGPREKLAFGGSVPLVVDVPLMKGFPSVLTADWQTFARDFHEKTNVEYRECQSASDCPRTWELGGNCRAWRTNQIVNSVCELTAFFGDARSFETLYRTAAYAECSGQLRRMQFDADICGGESSCLREVGTTIATKVMLPDERAEFEEMVRRDPIVLNLFTVSEEGFTFWFGDKALTLPRSWKSSSDDGTNTIRVPFRLLETVLPRYQAFVSAAQTRPEGE